MIAVYELTDADTTICLPLLNWDIFGSFTPNADSLVVDSATVPYAHLSYLKNWADDAYQFFGFYKPDYGQVDLRQVYQIAPEDIPASQMERYNHLKNIDSVFIYTDYAPRNTYDTRNSEDNLGRITVDMRLTDEGTERLTYRDRRLILPGFSVPDDFYNPDYSRRKPAESEREFYRRTLYWNPDLQLDNEGKATIRFYNNGHQTRIAVTADGMTTDGQLLTGSNSR